MHRPLAPALPPPSYPDDVIVRTFRPGVDDEAWVALNAAAFATHPEQGRLTVEDLRHRMAEPWFDPEGFFLAARGERLLGSHWTKVHPARPDAPGDADAGTRAIGEVYAVGVHPDAQGLGLGKALTLSGLHYLRDHGLDDVMLYVDGDNGAAVGLYERLGFTKTTVDVMYAG
jgi:mycothiol synthase